MCCKIYFAFITGESIINLIIQLLTFKYILKTIDKKTFGGSIGKKTYTYSLHFIANIFFIIIGIMIMINIKITDFLFFTLLALAFLSTILINYYILKKEKISNLNI
jgi:hypothetical protein